MAERYFDLNGREKCVTAIITVSDREFRISRVVIAARVLYSNHIRKMGELLRRVARLGDDEDSAEAKALAAEAENFASEKLDAYARIIRLILEKNGYEYSREWWEENTDEMDMRAFIEKCLMKDSPEADKKKEEAGKK